MQRSRLWLIVALVGLAVLVGCMKLAVIYTDYLWFASLNYESVFLKTFFTRLLLGIGFAILLFVVVWLNLRYARGTRGLVPYLPPAAEWSPFDRAKIEKYVNWGLLGAVLFVSVIAGIAASGRVLEFLRFLGAQPFGVQDPVFQNDLSLYVFKIPFVKYCLNFVAVVVVLAGVGVGLLYGLREELAVREGELVASSQARKHLFVLLGFLLLLKGAGYWLGTYGLLFSEGGVALGAFYTDVKARLPVLYGLAGLSVLAAAACLVPLRAGWSREKLALGGVIALVAVSFLGFSVYPRIVQSLVVRPNEVTKETPYIEQNIKATRAAFGLEGVQNQPFQVSYNLTNEDLRKNRTTIANIRLWDHRPLRLTYRQLQSIRTYYQFSGVDTDRYPIDGTLTQVMLAARQLDFSALPPEARRWVNQHLQWTHGYGLAMSPANTITPEGRPAFLIKDIPPVSGRIPVRRPEVYYGEFGQDTQEQPQVSPLGGGGEPPAAGRGPLPFGRPAAPSGQAIAERMPDDYVIVETSMEEFDYPKGDQNVYHSHKGTGGVPIGSLFRRLAFALRFTKLDIAITGSITPESRILFNRQIMHRARLIAPFLRFDRDPYLVVSEGALYWILDAYTATDKYPYSQRYGDGVNYVRNSVKVVISAFDGATDFYVFDPEDPIIRTYQTLFPRLFKPKEEMPPGLRQHIRYPKGLFTLQAQVLTMYHMRDPQVFYNREDPWNFAQEVVSSPEAGNSIPLPMEPYYMVMSLPKVDQEEFIIIVPFTPFNPPGSQAPKDNMIAWLAARCDPENYGQLLLFEFPKDEMIYGPKQIAARIDQDPDISASFTLWGQRGSSVIRGHLLVIPIERSLLYVQPIYLQATQAAIPQLERVIIAFGERLAMRRSLEEALQAVFGEGVPPIEPAAALPIPSAAMAPPKPAAPPPMPPAAAGLEQLLQQAQEQLQRTEEANRRTEQELKVLRETLERLRGQSSAP